MRPWFATVFMLGSCLGVFAEEEGKKPAELAEAKAILERTAEAMKKTKVVSYRAEYKVTGWATAFVPNMEGTVVVGQKSKFDIQPYSCRLKVQKEGSSEVAELNAGSDGEKFFVIDPKTKTVHEDIDPGVIGSSAWSLQMVVLSDFGAPDALEKLLKSAKLELKGTRKIGDEECTEVRIQADDPQDAVWAISTKDYLPRRITSVFKNGAGVESTTELALHDLVVNPTFVKSPFELVVPEGYKKTDDFAP